MIRRRHLMCFERIGTRRSKRNGFLLLGALREALFLGGAIGIVMLALTQAKSGLKSSESDLDLSVTRVDLEPIQSLNIDRDHQSLVIHSWRAGIEEIRLSDGSSMNQDYPMGCEAVDASETNSTSVVFHRWIEGADTIVGVSVVRRSKTIVSEEFEGLNDAIADVRVSGDGSLAMIVFHEGRVVAWDLAEGVPIRKEYALPMRAPCNRLSPDGNKLFIVSSDGQSAICNSRTGEICVTMPEISDCCRRTAWSRDSRHVAVGTQRGSVMVFDASCGQLIWENTKDLSFSQYIRFSTDGNRIAISGCDNRIRIWNIAQPDESPIVLKGSAGMIRDVVFTDSDRKLVSGGADGTIREWSLASQEMTRQIR